MKRILLFLAFLLPYFAISQQQNLNSFFELGATPNSLGGINFCNEYSPTSGTPDYFKSGGPQSVGVPKNFFGYQQDLFGGEAYVGFMATDISLPSESIVWDHVLDTNYYYEVTISISLANSSGYATELQYVIGENTVNLGYISDTVNWVTFTDTIAVDTVSSALVIGKAPAGVPVPLWPDQNTWAYYYIGQLSINKLGMVRPIVGTEDFVFSDRKAPKLLKCVNLHGQTVPKDSKGLVIEIYDNGQSRKLFRN